MSRPARTRRYARPGWTSASSMASTHASCESAASATARTAARRRGAVAGRAVVVSGEARPRKEGRRAAVGAGRKQVMAMVE